MVVTVDIVAAGVKARRRQGDVSKADDVARLFAETKKAFGTPNVLVNNAGVFRPGPFVETTEDTFHWHYNINVLGPVLTTLEAIKYFGDKGGSIINISSIVASHPRPMISIYSSAKSAVESATMFGMAIVSAIPLAIMLAIMCTASDRRSVTGRSICIVLGAVSCLVLVLLVTS